jgi:hypothetical protein
MNGGSVADSFVDLGTLSRGEGFEFDFEAPPGAGSGKD